MAWSFGVQLDVYVVLRDFSGNVSHPRGLRVSRYIVSVESSSLTHHRPYSNLIVSFVDSLMD